MERGKRRSRSQEEAFAYPDRGLGPREARQLYETVAGGLDRLRFPEEIRVAAEPRWAAFAQAYADYSRFASAPPVERDPDGPRWMRQSDLWTFYALGRVFETMVLRFQDGRARGGTSPRRAEPGLLREAILPLFDVLGMTSMRGPWHYHPFFHEVVEAATDPALGEAVCVEEEVWPGLWFGDLVFARAGVRVLCGPDAPFDPILATRSRLYFAWMRQHRPTRDLSHGWGSGSQWATAFRRDYADGALLRYNVDGDRDLTSQPAEAPPPHGAEDLTRAERIELLVHRCFVRTRKPDDDRWPYDDRVVAPAPAPDGIW